MNIPQIFCDFVSGTHSLQNLQLSTIQQEADVHLLQIGLSFCIPND